MSQNVPQCPIPNDNLDTPSQLAKVPPESPQPPIQPSSFSIQPSPDSPLPDRQLAAIDLLVLGQRDTTVAAAVGIDRKTLYRWRHHDPRFKEHLDRRRRELLDAATDRFRALLTDALDTFAKHLADPYAPTAHRAARALLSLSAIGRPPRGGTGVPPVKNPAAPAAPNHQQPDNEPRATDHGPRQ